MKHIFTVHSPITFLCAYSVCKDLCLSEDKVIIISSNYKPPFQFGRIVAPYHELNKGILAKIKGFNLPRAYDRYVDQLTGGEEFLAYIDLMHYWQRILVTNQQCKQFNFLEEGMNSYLKPDTLSEVTFVAKDKSFRVASFSEYIGLLYFAFRSYNHRLLNLPYWALGYRYLENVVYYCFSDLCYPGVKSQYKKVIPFYGNGNEGLILENVVIWVEDIYNKRHIPNQKLINEALETAGKYIHLQYGETHKHLIKLRPNGKFADSEIAPILKQEKIEFNFLEVAEPLELVLKRSKNIILVSATSSLLYYGKVMGHEAYTYFWLLKNRRYSAFEGMDYYWNLVKHIPERKIK